MQRRSLLETHEKRVSSATIRQEDGQEWLLEYYLQTIESPGGTIFGLRVDKSTLDGVLVEREETSATTEYEEQALAMIHAFAKGTVPPSVLLEMVDDWEY